MLACHAPSIFPVRLSPPPPPPRVSGNVPTPVGLPKEWTDLQLSAGARHFLVLLVVLIEM